MTIIDITNLPNQPVDVLKKRIKGGKPQNSTRLTVSLSLFHETFLTSIFQNNDFLKELRYYPTTYEAETFQTDVSPTEAEHIKFSSVLKAVHHEKTTLEARKVTKLHYRDLTSSNDDFSRYSQSIKLISTRKTTHPVDNETLDLYSEGATLCKFIHEGRPTTTKPTFVALPHLTSHSTFYECSKGILCQPQHSHLSPLTKLGVTIPYSICLERRITSPSTYIIHWNTTMESIQKKLTYSTSRKTTGRVNVILKT